MRLEQLTDEFWNSLRCQDCDKKATIEWDMGALAFCDKCALKFALALIRDVVEGEFGTNVANSRYAETMALLKK